MPEQLTSESLQAWLNDSNNKIFVAMFNERHLAALQVVIKEKQAQMSLLTVRDITRRRGIASNLIKEVEKQLCSEGVTNLEMDLSVIKKDEKAGLVDFMQACDYKITDNKCVKNL
ncbi:aspartate 1-decarboxylase autocleavage activator PanM [Psychromonas sp. MME1]|uniref:aspartate 1-decarboxylase autocleavage activator PanM n=1 Tax=Psychromonas sp. MME1 TaxID=3231032 RepID=UPI0034E2A243